MKKVGDYRKTLGVTKATDLKEIKSIYRGLMKDWHPDKFGDDSEKQAEAEGLHTVFIDAGFEWREPGCSMCLGMNPDILQPGERCASTSNRNFEGRQGKGGRTHLVSPQVAAATAIRGTLSSPADLVN